MVYSTRKIALFPKISRTRAFLKIKERNIPSKSVPGLYRLSSPDYKPLYHLVSFDLEDKSGKRGRFTAVTNIGSRQSNYKYQGVLICSGNMMETGNKTNRKNHALILMQNEKAQAIQIAPQAVEDYRNGLTPFQEELIAWGGKGWGCLKDGAPVFYVPEGDRVHYFGHSPNFRITSRLAVSGETRAANPRDFIPAHLRNSSEPDLVEAIFGWVENENNKDIGLKDQRAGRVFFTDARCLPNQENVWYKDEPIVPHVLSSPKSTTFQHYLVQDSGAGQNGHNPDDKKSLAYYGTSPGETQLRGHKFYWHKGKNPDLEANAAERKHPTQLTKIKPLRNGMRFQFKVHFENLRPEELGLLWWALALPNESNKQYRHKLGMGKPLGMGTVAISPKLFVSDRPERYQTLFNGEFWQEANRSVEAEPYIDAMNRYLLQEQGLGARLQNITELERIQALLTMLEWQEETTEWQSKTRYMEIERLTGRLNRNGEPETFNEYKERPILPDPFRVINEALRDYKPEKKSNISSKNKIDNRPRKTSKQKPTSDKEFQDIPEVSEDVSDFATSFMERLREQESTSTQPSLSDDETQSAVIEELIHGVVDSFNENRGYGLIIPDNIDDRKAENKAVFVHARRLSGIKTLREGQRVIFKLGVGMKGDVEAQDVRLEENIEP